GPAAQRGSSGGRAGRDTAQQGQRRPVTHPAPTLPVVSRDIVPGEGEDIVEERTIGVTEGIGGLLVLALGKGRVGFQVVADVCAPTLDQVPRELTAYALAFRSVEVRGEVGKLRIE